MSDPVPSANVMSWLTEGPATVGVSKHRVFVLVARYRALQGAVARLQTRAEKAETEVEQLRGNSNE